ncbi:MAG: putative 2OG-Fe(II) oxygenase [Pseudolabrys sp.]
MADRASRLRSEARTLLDQGIAYAPVIAALAIAESLLGNTDEVERLVDYLSFFRCVTIHPSGDVDDAAFRTILVRELSSHASYREKQKGKAGAGHYAFDVLDEQTPACRLLAQELHRQVVRYIAALPPLAGHPFVTSCPVRFALRGWSVATSGDDHFEPHIHPQAWLSGIYYLARPEVSRDVDAQRGWLHIGPPMQLGVSAEQGWSERSVEPVPGRLVLMPGYFYHGTRPTFCDETRICVAFNVVPEELDSVPPGAT